MAAWNQIRPALDKALAVSTRLMNKTILLVDDDAQIREALRKALRAEGYEVILAADGEEGLAKFRAHSVDLLLLDLNLPDQSGWDLFERLTAVNPLAPVVIITGRRDQSRSAAMAGVGALFEKPLDVPLLLQSVQDLLAEPAEGHLQRLTGLATNLRHVPPADTPRSSGIRTGPDFRCLAPVNNLRTTWP